jgi:hypothetical protein
MESPENDLGDLLAASLVPVMTDRHETAPASQANRLRPFGHESAYKLPIRVSADQHTGPARPSCCAGESRRADTYIKG